MRERLKNRSEAEIVKRPHIFSIIPNHWQQKTYDMGSGYDIVVEGEYVSDNEWNEIVAGIRRKFGENLQEVFSRTSNGVAFTVYLHKSVSININELK